MPEERGVSQRKQGLRTRLKRQRDAADEGQRVKEDALIAQRLRESCMFQEAAMVLSYVSFGSEVDTHKVIAAALAEDKVVAVPRCVPDSHQMEWHCIENLTGLVPGAFGILEPPACTSTLLSREDIAHLHCAGKSDVASVPGALDALGLSLCADTAIYGERTARLREVGRDAVVLVPGLAFDLRGFRIGYGGGYYDRFLAEFPGVSIGLVRQPFLVESLEALGAVDAFDRPVDYIATEDGIHRRLSS